MKIILVFAAWCLFFGNALGASFKFIALGDMPYKQATDFPKFERLIKYINSENPSFSIFVGDTKSGSTPCTNEHAQKMSGYFNSFKNPLIYSIGDNEWTDCHRILAGEYDPLERLDHIRKTQFQQRTSFGKAKLRLIRQADLMPAYSQFVENSSWVKNNVLFVSLHITGSNNNLGYTEESKQEYVLRNEANLAWIRYAYQQAKDKKYAAMIFAFQADLFYSPELATSSSSGYKDSLGLFRQLSEKVSTPVLLIHGDSHRLKIDQPLYGSNQRIIETVYRLQVMGADQMQGIEIGVDNQASSPFSFRPILILDNISTIDH